MPKSLRYQYNKGLLIYLLIVDERLFVGVGWQLRRIDPDTDTEHNTSTDMTHKIRINNHNSQDSKTLGWLCQI